MLPQSPLIGSEGEHNPYEPPAAPLFDVPTARSRSAGLTCRFGLAWAAVFSLNMVVPLLFGSSMAREHGTIGIGVAGLILFGLGLLLRAVYRRVGRALVVGGCGVGLSQVVPILQIMAGAFALGAGESLGLVNGDDEMFNYRLLSESAGFVITFLVGGLLMFASVVLGSIYVWFTPRRWWEPKSPEIRFVE